MTPSDLTGLPDNILRKMVEEARAEAARQALLVQRYEPAYLGLPHVVRERDEARDEVARLEGLILDWDRNDYMSGPLLAEARRIRAQRELPTSQPARAIEVCKRAQREEERL